MAAGHACIVDSRFVFGVIYLDRLKSTSQVGACERKFEKNVRGREKGIMHTTSWSTGGEDDGGKEQDAGRLT